MHSFVLASYLVAALPLAAHAATYTILTNSTGTNFWDAWNFAEGGDDTAAGTNSSGNTVWQNQADAISQGLAVINPAGNAVLRVDNVTTPTNPSTYGRNSTLLFSKDPITKGSLVVFDALHMPFGCGVWPAVWGLGREETWPLAGEMDLVEYVNKQTTSKFSLHTAVQNGSTCSTSASTLMSGTIESVTDCTTDPSTGKNGCLVDENKPNAAGAGFASAGGGAYALLWDDTGISMWFFPRANVPADLSTASPNPSGWATPSAFYSQSSCNTDLFFGPQTLVIDINICGNYGNPTFNATCSGVAQTCEDLVANPRSFDTAWFEFQFLRVFTDGSNPSNTTSTTASGTATGTTASSTTSGSKSTGTTKASGALQSVAMSASWVVGVVCVVMAVVA